MRFFVAAFLLFFSLTSAANADNSGAANVFNQSDCAAEEDIVTPGDGTLCKEDIAFAIMHEMFPSLFKELIPLWSLSSFNLGTEGDGAEEPELLGEYYGDRVFFILFDLFYKLVLLLIGVYVGTLVLSIVFRKIRGVPISGNDLGEHRDTPSSWVVGGLAGTAMLVPIKEFFLGTMIIFSMAVSSLSMANFIFSLFLSAQQELFESSIDAEARTSRATNEFYVDRHDYLSEGLYRYLVKMEVCRHESVNYLVSKNLSAYQDPIPLQEYRKCLFGTESIYSHDTAEIAGAGPFTWPSAKELPVSLNGEDAHYGLASIDFGNRALMIPQCEVPNTITSVEYGCGRIEVSQPEFSKNPLITLLGEQEFFANIDAISGTLKPTLGASQVESVVNRGWASMKTSIESAIVRWAQERDLMLRNDTVEVEKLRKFKALKMVQEDSEGLYWRRLIAAYHQNANNILAFGSFWGRQDVDSFFSVDEPGTINNFGESRQDLSSLYHHQHIAQGLAQIAIEAQCMDRFYGLDGANMLLDFLAELRSDLPPDSTARCVNWGDKKLYGQISGRNEMGINEIREATIAEFNDLAARFEEDWEDATSKYASQRRAVEASFSSAMQSIDVGNWWVKMRQEGYLAGASYFFLANGKIEDYKRGLVKVNNHYDLSTPEYDSKYVGLSIEREEGLEDSFPDFISGDELFDAVERDARVIDPIVGKGHWIARQEQMLRQPKLHGDDAMSLDTVIDFALDPVKNLNRMGISIAGKEKNPEDCMTDPEKCPFPITDPIIELNQFGYDMVSAAVDFYSIAITAKLISSTVLFKKDFFSGAIGEKAGGNATDGNNIIFKVADTLGIASDYMFSTFATLIALYWIVGALLAYLLPLLPMLYLYMKFISWIMVVLMASFSILLWAMYWVRFKEKRQIIRDAGFHFGLEIMLKPSLSLLSVIYAWYFFYVVAFVVGGTMSWMNLLPLDGQGGMGMRYILDPFFAWMLIAYVYFVGLSFSYKIMDQMQSELFEKLGISGINEQNKMGMFLQTVMYQKGQQLLTKMNLSLAKDPVRNKMEQRYNASKQAVDDLTNSLKKAGM